MDYMIGIIEGFGGTFIPYGWLACNGQLVSIQDNQALFSIIGTIYGGDGVTNFAVPNLNTSVAVGANLSNNGAPTPLNVNLGETGGATTVTLITNNIPSHSHVMYGTATDGTTATPDPTMLLGQTNDPATNPSTPVSGYTGGTPSGTLGASTVSMDGLGMAHNNVMPTSVLTYCICAEGVYPSRN